MSLVLCGRGGLQTAGMPLCVESVLQRLKRAFVFRRRKRVNGGRSKETPPMAEKFERHRQAWTTDEIQKLHLLATKGMSLKAISKAMTRSEESVQARAKVDKLKIAKMR